MAKKKRRIKTAKSFRANASRFSAADKRVLSNHHASRKAKLAVFKKLRTPITEDPRNQEVIPNG